MISIYLISNLLVDEDSIKRHKYSILDIIHTLQNHMIKNEF